VPSRTLWKIPDPAQLVREAAARREVAEKAKQDRARGAEGRKAREKRAKVLREQAETERRATECREWFAGHRTPTRKELAELLAEEFPDLKERIRR
jgi:hypothetical protein